MKFAKIVFLARGNLRLADPPADCISWKAKSAGTRRRRLLTRNISTGFWERRLAWQVVFLVVSTDPVRYRAMILPSILEKVATGLR